VVVHAPTWRHTTQFLVALLGGSLGAGCALLPSPESSTRDLVARAAEIAPEVAQVRGLSVRSAVPTRLRDEAGAREDFRESIAEEWDAHAEGMERAYKRFGLIPEELDLESYLPEFFGGEVAGYYQPRTGALTVVESAHQDADPGERTFVLAHELVHALQDQHFDLEAMDEARRERSDAAFALQSVIEGDATLAAVDHLLSMQGVPTTLADPALRTLYGASAPLVERFSGEDEEDTERLREAPAVLRRGLLFPYLGGATFVARVRVDYGWAGVNALYNDPPESSEQVLHPERYVDSRDRPVRISLAAAPAGFEPVFEETLGMFDLQTLLIEFLGDSSASAADGWDGDRYVLWRTPAGEALGFVSVWDRESQARDFERTYRALLERKGVKSFAVERRGDTVVAVEGTDAGETASALESLFASQLERPADDHVPDGRFTRALTWPVWARRLDAAREAGALGGHLAYLRYHAQGHRFALADGLLLRSERTPDRQLFSGPLSFGWVAAERNYDFWSLGLLPLGAYQRRGDRQAGWLVTVPFVGGLVRTVGLDLVLPKPFTGTAFDYLRTPERSRVSLASGLLFEYDRQAGDRRVVIGTPLFLRIDWNGEGRRRARLFFVPIPLPGGAS
jgi:hypothetical protein